jgi:uncharacterized protein YycO
MFRLKKAIRYFFLAVIGIVLSAWLFREIYNKLEEKKQKATLYLLKDSEKTLIHDGDIILRYGHGLVSDYIVNYFKEDYRISHCGIISKQGDSLHVIHSESSSMLSKEGIQSQDFDEFTDAGHLNSVIIVRYNRADSQKLPEISKRAHYYLQKEIPFDYSFNHKDTSQMYCSEIIWHIFLDVFEDDIFTNSEGVQNFKQFKNFWDSSQFDIILNHQSP